MLHHCESRCGPESIPFGAAMCFFAMRTMNKMSPTYTPVHKTRCFTYPWRGGIRPPAPGSPGPRARIPERARHSHILQVFGWWDMAICYCLGVWSHKKQLSAHSHRMPVPGRERSTCRQKFFPCNPGCKKIHRHAYAYIILYIGNQCGKMLNPTKWAHMDLGDLILQYGRI